MKRVFIIIAALAAAAAWADQPVTFDWNAAAAIYGSLTDTGSGPVLYMQDTLGLEMSLRHGLGNGFMTYLLGGGLSYTPQELEVGDNLLSALLPFPGVSYIQWESVQTGLHDLWFRVRAGRIEADEPTGLLFRDPDAITPLQLMDGVSTELRAQWFYAALEAGYLGLLDKRINRIRFTAQDFAELDDAAVYAAPPRLLAVLRVEGEEILPGQSLGLFGIWQKDFRADPAAFDGWYIGLAVRGSIIGGLSQETSLTTAITVPAAGATGFGLLASMEIDYDIGVDPLGTAWLSARWGSGDGGGLAAFPGLAGPAVSFTYAEPLVDIICLELGIDASLSVPPADAALDPSLAVRLLLTPSGAMTAGYGFAPAGAYLGTEIEASLSYEPLSGILVEANGGVFITAAAALPFLELGAEVRL